MLEPWEVILWMSLLALVAYAVLAACFINPRSICNSTLVAVRNSLAARGGRRAGAGRGSQPGCHQVGVAGSR